MKLNFSTKFKSILIPLLFVVLFIGIILIIKLPISQVFEYDLDEGYNVIKSLLFLNGFSLYREIWSDQPPLFTLVLSYCFKLFGPSVHHGRLLILIFSGIFLWAFYQTIKNLWGSFCAFTAVVFLLLSTLFLCLHISVMLCTPARALAMLSIYFITLYKKSCSKRFLVLSGIFMALSLHAKLIMLFLVPLIALEIAYVKWLSLKAKKV